jgi:hypothetical protein
MKQIYFQALLNQQDGLRFAHARVISRFIILIGVHNIRVMTPVIVSVVIVK